MSPYVSWKKILKVISPALVFLLLTGAPSLAKTRDKDAALSLETAPIADIRAAAKRCKKADRPVIDFKTIRGGLSTWPGQYIQLSWNVKAKDGSDWKNPVYLRLGEEIAPGEPAAETVTPLWTKSFKASLLREGVHTYYLVTRCGVAGVDVGLISRPVITKSPKTIFKGDIVTIKGRNFMDYSPNHLLRVIVAEAGMDHPIKVIEWNDTEIIALATFDTEYGKHELVVDKGLNSKLHRRSAGKSITVVKRDTFPPVMISSAIDGAFSGLKIRLNTYGPSPEGTYYEAWDSYIEPSSGMALAGQKRVNLDISEYNLSPATKGNSEIKGPLYYINDISTYITKVLTQDGLITMTLFFEDLHDEFIGRAANPDAATPPTIQLDNLRVEFKFTLVEMDGLIAPEFLSIETKGDFRSTGSFCDYADIEICKTLYTRYEEDIINGLTEKINAMMDSEKGKKAFAWAFSSWLLTQKIGEVTGSGFTGGSFFIDHIPR